ncbi:nudC domain-containing protein 3 [Coccinella septempunctata]|uniref:nudC domain-containing protein 3 n=1 Tax=Coccinella septempunctata TaxID=41139 RepID=UPI001D07D85A|nr:nudC domain-containing protein 3 [Coccinella septempunctata]
MSDETVHDDMLFHMLQECKTLPIFMDHIFGFLKRRTDFYVVSTGPTSPVGLPAGYAEKLVKHSFDKFSNIRHNATSHEQKAPSEKKEKITSTSNNLFDPSKSYNGASFEKYSWSQLYNEVDLFLKLPENVKSRDLIVQSTSKNICVKLKDGTVLLSGDLCQFCKLDPIWSIDNGELQVHFEKVKEIWWDRFLTSEPKLDISKIDCTKPMEDLPDDAQAKIQELQWNQEQKRLGLPTSDEIKNLNTLKKAWNAEGSPFSGPFDPSSVSFS